MQIHLRSMWAVVVAVTSFSISGCDLSKPGIPTVSPPSRPVSLITPIEFFSPEQKRLSQHLNWSTGCFKVEYAGPKAWLGTSLQVWTDGKPPALDGNFATIEAGVNEVSVSVRDDTAVPRGVRVVQVLSSKSSFSSSRSTLTQPDLKGWSTRSAAIEGATELRRGEEVAVWALMLFKSQPGKDDYQKPGESVMDQVKRSDWAIVLKVALDPPGH